MTKFGHQVLTLKWCCCHRQLAPFPVATCRPLTSEAAKRAKQHTSTGQGRLSLFKIWGAFMVDNAQLLILLPLETRQVTPNNTVVLTLKLGNQT